MKDITLVDWNRYKIAIVMANYNKEVYIKQAIESVLIQKTSFNYILVIVDDDSSDSSAEIIAEYEIMYPEKILTIYSEKNEGYLKSQIKAYQDMKTEYFTLLDPDDFWLCDFWLEDAVSYLDTHEEYVACGFNTRVVRNGMAGERLFCPIKNDEMSYGKIEDYFEGQCVMPHTSATIYRNIMYQKKVIKQLVEVMDTLAESSFRGDTDRFIICLKYGKIKFINKIVSTYRVYEGGIWSGASYITQLLMRLRAQLDYSDFYEGQYENQFINIIRNEKVEIINSVFNTKYICKEEDRERDSGNYYFIMQRLMSIAKIGVLEKDIENIWKFVNVYDGEPIVIWGCGCTAETLLERYNIKNIKYFIDSDKEKQGKTYHNSIIKAPTELEDGYYVVVMSMYYDEIRRNIERSKLCNPDYIINLYGYDRL